MDSLCGAGSRNRTGTPLGARDFESRASTSSAIPARERNYRQFGLNGQPGSVVSIDIMRAMRIEEFDYELPSALIAQFPPAERTAGRMLHLDGNTGACSDHRFADLPRFVREGDLFVFNDTRVIKARLLGVKQTGGRVEALVERVVTARRALAMLRASHAPSPGQKILFGNADTAVVVERQENFFLLEFGDDVLSVLDRLGEVPLPPYIERPAGIDDLARYQTVYARNPGAVAAPTAGLHFDQAMLDRIAACDAGLAYVTLHVGAGTFQPVRVDEVDRHVMHSERYSIPEATVRAIADVRSRGGRVTAVGTTSLRALEAAAQSGELISGEGETRLFITPGYGFRLVDRLLTNFHLPRSTLLMLVSAFAGIGHVRAAYRHAVDHGYRFFSYGDAMLIDRAAASLRGAT
jgi:S-adenosylmethionine:tRNA ribosyltransferase-isomerase